MNSAVVCEPPHLLQPARYPRHQCPSGRVREDATVQVKIRRLRDSARLPEYQTEQAAGMDLAADIDVPLVLAPGERRGIPTGLAIALPAGCEAQVRGRSGLAIRAGVTMANGVGTIDADYRGEIKVLLINLGSEPFTVEPGMRVAQLVVARFERVDWAETSELDDTARGSGGFGHTGT